MKKLTTRQLITNLLTREPNQTATQIAHRLKKSVGLVSGILQVDHSKKRVFVSRAKGPNGGVVYKSYRRAN